VVYVFGLLAACLLGFGFVLQQHAAVRAPLSDMLTFRLLLDLVRMPLWLGGIGCMVVGQVLGALALANGDLSRVEPLLATNLLFAMALARWFSDERLGWSGWSGVAALSGGVAAFIAAGEPHSGSDAVGPLRHWLVFSAVVLVAGLLVQSAFEAGPLRLSLPALSAAEPVSGIVCGIGFLDDRLNVSPGALAWQAAGLAAVVTGVFLLGRHPAMPSGRPASARHGSRVP
jgi:drug/metabolite transporter (DMT)-like permease